MVDEINYSNLELEEKLKKIFENKYGVLQPIIIDILLKRKFVFKLSEEQTIMEAERFIDNVGCIEFQNIGYGGITNVQNRKIILNSAFIKKLNFYPTTSKNHLNMLYKVLVHEICHMLSNHYEYYNGGPYQFTILNCSKENVEKYNEVAKISTGICEYPESSNSYCVAMDEIFNEAAAGMLYERERNAFSYDEYGYANLMFFPHLLSAAIGTTDEELIYAGNVSSRFFNRTICSQYGINFDEMLIDNEYKIINSEYSKVMDMMRYIDTNMDLLYTVCAYQKGNEHKLIESIFLIKSTFESIIEATYDMARMQIEADSRTISNELVDELLVRYKKMDSCVSIGKRKLHISNKSEKIDLKKEELLNNIFCIYAVNQIKSEVLNESDLKEYTMLAKAGDISSLEKRLKDGLGINIDTFREKFVEYIKSEEYINSNYYHKLETDDLFGGKSWNSEKDREMVDIFLEEAFQNCRLKRGFRLDKPIHLIGIALGRLGTTFKGSNIKESVELIHAETGIPNRIMEKYYLEQEYLTYKCEEELNTYGKVTQENMEYIACDKEQLMSDFQELYVNYISIIYGKNEFNPTPLDKKEIMRSAIGLREMKKEKARILKRLKKRGIISKEQIEEFNEAVRSSEKDVDEQIKQLYILAQLAKRKKYQPTDEEIENAKNAALNKEYLKGFCESDFEKDIKIQMEIDAFRDFFILPFEDIRKKVVLRNLRRKNINILPEGTESQNMAENSKLQNSQQNLRERIEIQGSGIVGIQKKISQTNDERDISDR